MIFSETCESFSIVGCLYYLPMAKKTPDLRDSSINHIGFFAISTCADRRRVILSVTPDENVLKNTAYFNQ